MACIWHKIRRFVPDDQRFMNISFVFLKENILCLVEIKNIGVF